MVMPKKLAVELDVKTGLPGVYNLAKALVEQILPHASSGEVDQILLQRCVPPKDELPECFTSETIADVYDAGDAKSLEVSVSPSMFLCV